MRYYISCPSFIQPKNRAQTQIQEFVKTLGNMMVNSEGDLNHLIAWIKKEVETVNFLYLKCKPLEVKVYNHENCDSVGIHIVLKHFEYSLVSLSAYKIYAVYETQPEFSHGFIQKCIL
jgi:hypothetical protein